MNTCGNSNKGRRQPPVFFSGGENVFKNGIFLENIKIKNAFLKTGINKLKKHVLKNKKKAGIKSQEKSILKNSENLLLTNRKTDAIM